MVKVYGNACRREMHSRQSISPVRFCMMSQVLSVMTHKFHLLGINLTSSDHPISLFKRALHLIEKDRIHSDALPVFSVQLECAVLDAGEMCLKAHKRVVRFRAEFQELASSRCRRCSPRRSTISRCSRGCASLKPRRVPSRKRRLIGSVGAPGADTERSSPGSDVDRAGAPRGLGSPHQTRSARRCSSFRPRRGRQRGPLATSKFRSI